MTLAFMARRALSAIVLLLATSTSLAFASECVEATPELSAMERATLGIRSGTGAFASIEVFIADSRDERAAGFQHLCRNLFPQTAILFVFGQDKQPAFHMFNVHGPLDIAFIDAEGKVIDVRRMEPYGEDPTQHQLYGAPRPFRYALEMEAGRSVKLGLTPGSRVTLP